MHSLLLENSTCSCCLIGYTKWFFNVRLPDKSWTLSIRAYPFSSASTSFLFLVSTSLIFPSIVLTYIFIGFGSADLPVSSFLLISTLVSTRFEHAAWMWSQQLTSVQDVISFGSSVMAFVIINHNDQKFSFTWSAYTYKSVFYCCSWYLSDVTFCSCCFFFSCSLANRHVYFWLFAPLVE